MAQSLVDVIEHYGAQVAARAISRDEAAHRVQQYSDGGLTLIGARDVIDSWRTIRAQYQAGMNRTLQLLRELEG